MVLQLSNCVTVTVTCILLTVLFNLASPGRRELRKFSFRKPYLDKTVRKLYLDKTVRKP